jgi:hypothetical protein
VNREPSEFGGAEMQAKTMELKASVTIGDRILALIQNERVGRLKKRLRFFGAKA